MQPECLIMNWTCQASSTCLGLPPNGSSSVHVYKCVPVRPWPLIPFGSVPLSLCYARPTNHSITQPPHPTASPTATNRRLNYLWAMGYNVCMIPVAAGVLYPAFKLQLPPWIAGFCMAFSSVSVVMSSLALRRYKRPVLPAVLGEVQVTGGVTSMASHGGAGQVPGGTGGTEAVRLPVSSTVVARDGCGSLGLLPINFAPSSGTEAVHMEAGGTVQQYSGTAGSDVDEGDERAGGPFSFTGEAVRAQGRGRNGMGAAAAKLLGVAKGSDRRREREEREALLAKLK